LLVTGLGHRLLMYMPMPDALLQLVSLLLSQARAETSHHMGIGLKGQGYRGCSALRYRTVGLIQPSVSSAEGCPLPLVDLAETIPS